MKKSILIGLIAGITGLVIGYKVPKDKNVGYVMISGRITNPEQAGKYFEAVNDVVVKGKFESIAAKVVEVKEEKPKVKVVEI